MGTPALPVMVALLRDRPPHATADAQERVLPASAAPLAGGAQGVVSKRGFCLPRRRRRAAWGGNAGGGASA